MDDSSCQGTISKSNPVILNYYRQFLLKGFDWRYFEILSNLNSLNTIYYQLDLSQYYVITFKVDKTFDYEGLEQAIYEAVSSYGIDNKSQWFSLIKSKIPNKEFSVESVQYLILKL